jgi:hypothetical protein
LSLQRISEISDDPIRRARRWFAEELRFVTRAGVRDVIDITRTIDVADVIEAFATVPRERFVGPGPLRVLSPWDMNHYWTPADQSAAAVYHDVLIAYDEKRWLNNGLPSLWAFVFDKLRVARGERVLHAFACDRGVSVKSVRTDRHAEDESCWLHGDGWCLSRREIERADGQAV